MDTWHLTLYCKSIHLYSQTLIIFILQGYIQTSVSFQLGGRSCEAVCKLKNCLKFYHIIIQLFGVVNQISVQLECLSFKLHLC